MVEISVRDAVQNLVFHSESFEKIRQYDAAHRVDGVYAYFEMCVPDCLSVYESEVEHRVDMLLVERVVLLVVAQVVNVAIVEVFLLGNLKHFVAVSLCEELAFVVQQFQCVPLARVVAGCDDDTPGSLRHYNGKLRSRSGGKTDVEHVVAHANQCTAHHAANHLAADARVSAHNDGVAVRFSALADECGVCRHEFHYVQRIQRVACLSAYRSADTGNRLYQCHIFEFLFIGE